MKTKNKGNGWVEISCGTPGNALHRRGTDTYAPDGKTMIRSDSLEDWEEVGAGEYRARMLEDYREREYRRRLAAAIHERYSLDDEIALAANVNSQALMADDERAAGIAAEYEAYQRYRAACKERVRLEVGRITEVPEDSTESDGISQDLTEKE